MSNLTDISNALIFILIAVAIIFVVVSIKFKWMPYTRKDGLYYMLLIGVFLVGLSIHASTIGLALSTMQNRDIISIIELAIMIIIGYLLLVRYRRYANVNPRLQKTMIFIDAFFFGMLLGSLYEVLL